MLRRTPFRREPPKHEPCVEREPRPLADRTEIFPVLKPATLHRGVYSGSTSGPAPKDSPVRSKKIRDSAKGEACLIRLPGCPGDPAMTIWSHYRGAAGGKGRGIKASDVAGAYGCTHCDAIYDGNAPRPAGMTKADVDLAWHEGHIRSLVRLRQKGLL